MRIVATADRTPEPVPEAPRPIPDRHTVESGDSLWRIARATLVARGHPATGTDVASFWPRIYEANREIIGGDPHLIHPGQVLELPESGSHAEVTYGT